MRTTLRQLLVNHAAGVIIPKLQRDYAQGRESATRIRRRFLRDLHTALQDSSPPLNLDFVYGSQESAGAPLLPLDGQQRLTTLFLLHWYLALRDGQLDHFRTYAQHQAGSRFNYEVRPTATAFFDKLVTERVQPELGALLPPDPGRSNALSRTLQNQSWFFLSYVRAPTVRCCLTVIAGLHAQLGLQGGARFAPSSRFCRPNAPGWLIGPGRVCMTASCTRSRPESPSTSSPSSASSSPTSSTSR